MSEPSTTSEDAANTAIGALDEVADFARRVSRVAASLLRASDTFKLVTTEGAESLARHADSEKDLIRLVREQMAHGLGKPQTYPRRRGLRRSWTVPKRKLPRRTRSPSGCVDSPATSGRGDAVGPARPDGRPTPRLGSPLDPALAV